MPQINELPWMSSFFMLFFLTLASLVAYSNSNLLILNFPKKFKYFFYKLMF